MQNDINTQYSPVATGLYCNQPYYLYILRAMMTYHRILFLGQIDRVVDSAPRRCDC